MKGFKPDPGQHDLLTPFTLCSTSETIIYPYFRHKIKTHRNLPMKVSSWVKIIRWEVSDNNPLTRCHEFDWLDGHSTFATKEEFYDEVLEFLSFYSCVYEKILAVPVIKGVKSGKEKFSGADYTTNIEEFIVPNECGVRGAGVRAIVDERDNYTCRWKYADWEMKGVFLKIGNGPSKLEKNRVRIVRHDTGVKMDVLTVDLVKRVKYFMVEIHRELFFVAKRKLEEIIQKVETSDEFQGSLRQKKLSLAPCCEEGEVENIV
ncbi:Class II aaRS and biotin synthetases superfamily protein [Raphanus sativus]|nr:Class II aaRS and biotin synthetases superfamily protein [Raphanus sativus]KAJ4905691.1 Class II aaRS and biotin synthetases superfamily protein [Raphanus sativus]